MKQQKIPKLELQDALYSVRLKQSITDNHDIQIESDTLDQIDDLATVAAIITNEETSVLGQYNWKTLDLSTVDEWKYSKCTTKSAEKETRGVNDLLL